MYSGKEMCAKCEKIKVSIAIRVYEGLRQLGA